MSKVFVVQNPTKRTHLGYQPVFDLSDAKRYGELAVMLGPTANPFEEPEASIENLKKHLLNYSINDYILLIGSPYFIGAAVSIASDNNLGRVNVLQWNSRRRIYHPLQLNLR